jgi:hypothetical protein
MIPNYQTTNAYGGMEIIYQFLIAKGDELLVCAFGVVSFRVFFVLIIHKSE